MAYIGKKDIINIFQSNTAIQTVYQCGVIIWQAIRSCFGSGVWINEKPWLNDEAWKNK